VAFDPDLHWLDRSGHEKTVRPAARINLGGLRAGELCTRACRCLVVLPRNRLDGRNKEMKQTGFFVWIDESGRVRNGGARKPFRNSVETPMSRSSGRNRIFVVRGLTPRRRRWRGGCGDLGTRCPEQPSSILEPSPVGQSCDCDTQVGHCRPEPRLDVGRFSGAAGKSDCHQLSLELFREVVSLCLVSRLNMRIVGSQHCCEC